MRGVKADTDLVEYVCMYLLGWEWLRFGSTTGHGEDFDSTYISDMSELGDLESTEGRGVEMRAERERTV